MKGKSRLIAFLAMLALVFVSTQFLGAQESADEEELIEFLEEINELEALDHMGLLTRLSETFDVEVEELEALIAEGYSPGELWLALEVSQVSGIALADALLLTEGSEGHGWGVLSKTLGIDPGSAEFHELKGTWAKNKGVMVREINMELQGKLNQGQNKGSEDQGQGNRNQAGEGQAGSAGGKGSGSRGK
jgi:hypothetical protein